MDDLSVRILALLKRPDYKPLRLKALADVLQVTSDDYQDLRAEVKRLVAAGVLAKSTDKTLSLPAQEARPGTVIGTFRRNARGFGFVRPLKESGRHNDIFIAAEDSRDASSGDEVAVRLVRKSGKQDHARGPSGRIVKIMARASGTFVGTYHEQPDGGYARVDGTTFHSPIYVGDPGAKGAKPGDKVVIEVVRFPSPDQEGEGVIIEVLGPRGQSGVDTLSVIRAFGLPEEFDEETLEEARLEARGFDENEIGERLDLRDTLTVTIDPATARDFDDAISLERDEEGYWNLGVHIADVSHFVQPGTALDRTAHTRGTSVYLPDRVLPMLPEVISNSLASLQAARTRYTVSALLQFNAEGVRTACRFARSAIRVDHRFSYERAFEVMMNPKAAHEGVDPAVCDLLGRMLDLARILRKRRFAKGALELVMPEVEVDLGDSGEVVGAHLASNDESHQVIEDFMLAANEAVASQLADREIPFLRRVHGDPEPRKLAQFAEFAASLGFPLEDEQSRFELQRVLRESSAAPERYAMHFALLRSLKRAIYTPEPEGHYALASDDYCHFTSPIRRYPDLQVHRQLVALLAGKKPRGDVDELVVLGEHCTRTERRAEAAERELIRVKLLTYLESKVGEQFNAVIIGVEDFGFFCQLIELPVEGMVHVSSLASDYYDFDRDTHTLVGRRAGRRFRLGDHLAVRVAHVDVDRRELDLVVAGAHGDNDPEANLPPSRTAGRSRSPRSATPPRQGRTSSSSGSRPQPATPNPKKSPKKPGKGRGKRRG